MATMSEIIAGLEAQVGMLHMTSVRGKISSDEVYDHYVEFAGYLNELNQWWEENAKFFSANECWWCGLPTQGQHYCSEVCRESDYMPICEFCGDKIEYRTEVFYDDDDRAYHSACLEGLMTI